MSPLRRVTLTPVPVAVSALVALVVGASACLPSFEDRPWLVEDARVLAIRSTPAEARPGQVVSYEALIADPDGLAPTTVSWALCLEPRTAEERGAVSQACALGEALSTTPNPAVLPTDACARFGPNTPPTQADEPARRPADPDASGGYAIPVRAAAMIADDEVAAFGKTRLRCDLAGATRPVFEEFEARYSDNQNPELDALVDVPATASPGARVALRVRTAADAVEDYVVYEIELGTLRDARESLHLRWYVDAGELERGAERVDGEALELGAPVEFNTTWVAPTEPGLVRGWAVLADDRGGTSWTSFEITVQ